MELARAGSAVELMCKRKRLRTEVMQNALLDASLPQLPKFVYDLINA
jgi:hypothetical protein